MAQDLGARVVDAPRTKVEYKKTGGPQAVSLVLFVFLQSCRVIMSLSLVDVWPPGQTCLVAQAGQISHRNAAA